MRTTGRATSFAAVSALLLTVLAAGGAGASERTSRTSEVGCATASTRFGRIGGIAVPGRSRPTAMRCGPRIGRTPPSQPSSGSPPLSYHGGPVMGTSQAVTVTPVYWAPSGYSFPSAYQQLTEQFVTDVAHDSGDDTNVFSNLTQYTDGSDDPIDYHLIAGTPIDDADAFPHGGCTPDSGEVYSDGAGYTACVTDAQIQAELAAVLGADHLTSDLSHIYLLYLPKGVESCFTSANNTQSGQCSISAQGGAFCGYHSSFPSGASVTVYANLPYAIEDSPTNGYTCGSDGGLLQGDVGVGNQSPNGDLDADTVISVTSHEMSESITDPELSAWFDSGGNEVADDCAYVYGDSATYGGAAGSEYNQTINGHHYFVQEEFSNSEFAVNPASSCIQESLPQTISFTSTPPSTPVAPSTYDVTATSTSSLPVSLTIDDASASVCSITGGVVTFDTDGACTIDAAETGSDQFLPATEVQQTVDVGSFDGSGTIGVDHPSVLAGSTGDTLTFTYTAAASGPTSGEIDVTVPTGRGWTAPTAIDGAAGQVTSTCGTVGIASSTIEVTGVTLSGHATCAIAYGTTADGGAGASAPVTPGTDQFAASESQSVSGTATPLTVSPQVAATPAGDGTGTLVTATPSLVVGASATTLSFTYTAAAGGTNEGELQVAVPAGWSPPSTSLTAPGFTTSSCGGVTALGATITVQGIDLRSEGSCTLVYGSTVGAGPGATVGTALGEATFGTTERSASSGTLTALATSPALSLIQASSVTTLSRSAPSVTFGHEQVEHLMVRVRGMGSAEVAAGTVSIRDRSVLLCSPALVDGTATCALAATRLAPGPAVLSAVYAGSPTVGASSSGTVRLTVVKQTSRTVLALSARTLHVGAEDHGRFVISVHGQFAGAATGRVEVLDGGRVLCTVRLASSRGSCSLGARTLAKGSYLLAARYLGDPEHEGSVSTRVRLTVT